MSERDKAEREIHHLTAVLYWGTGGEGATLYRKRCGWCGAYEGTVDPNEPCVKDETGFIGPHQFGVLEQVERPTPAASEDVRERVAPDWSEARKRANVLWAVLRENGFEHLRDALVGQHSDAMCYGQWERHKALLRDLLDVLDAALRSEAQGDADALAAADMERVPTTQGER